MRFRPGWGALPRTGDGRPAEAPGAHPTGVRSPQATRRAIGLTRVGATDPGLSRSGRHRSECEYPASRKPLAVALRSSTPH